MSRMRKGDEMITIHSLDVNGLIFTGFHLQLPGTEILIVMNEVGYIISSALFTELITDEKDGQHIIAGAVSPVKTIDDLLYAPLETITEKARHKGWAIGMCGKDALLKIA